MSSVQNTSLFCSVLDRIDALTVCSPCCPSKGRESRRSPLRAGHQAAQQPVSIQRLLQCAALCAGLAAEGCLPGARLQELGAERRLGQRGGGGVPRASRQVAKGESLEAEPGLLLIWQNVSQENRCPFYGLKCSNVGSRCYSAEVPPLYLVFFVSKFSCDHDQASCLSL